MKINLFYFLFLILVNLFYYAQNTTASPIINGLPDERHLFKFHVSIHKKNGPENVYIHSCSGSIISERYILTAAHCLITIENNVIREIFYPAGRTKIIAGTNQRNGPGIERDLIRAFIPLEHTVGSNILADIAVGELSADLGVHQHPDRLRIMSLDIFEPRPNTNTNQRGTLCGFGHDALVRQRNGQWYPTRSDSTVNKYMNVIILGRDECPTFETMVCGRNAERTVFRTACYGDSGTGLVYRNKIIGVLSIGPRYCNSLEPIEFTRLNGYMKFIEEAQNPRGDHRRMYVVDEKPKSPEPPSPERPNEGASSSSAGGKKKGFWPFEGNNHHGRPA